MFPAVLSFLGSTTKTTETKALIVAALWAVSASFIPGVPISLPPMDFGAMGSLVASPVALVAIALVQVVKKVFTNGATPFLPTPVDPASKDQAP